MLCQMFSNANVYALHIILIHGACSSINVHASGPK